jgi:trehalose/maltose hydrolase-like predicted phosphorylase
MSDLNLWTLTEDRFKPAQQHHKETIFTIGNGYLSTRGAFEEGYPGYRRATFIHGVFDAAPIVVTELANAPDWLPFSVHLNGANGERFALNHGAIESYQRSLDLRSGLLAREVRWVSPGGRRASLRFERFASLAQPHQLLLRCRLVPEFDGPIEFRAALNGHTHNDGLLHWQWIEQGQPDGAGRAFLRCRTRHSGIECVGAMRLSTVAGGQGQLEYWDAEGLPTLVQRLEARAGQEIVVDKYVALYTSRDVPPDQVQSCALSAVNSIPGWDQALAENQAAWQEEWARTDVEIDGDQEAQIALRFNLFQMLIAAPRHDGRVNIGAKTLSGFGYRGHAFWDTEIFMLPLFTYTAPHIARNLLNYRHRLLPGARAKAKANGFEGAQFPWESADTGEEVTPTWVPHFADRTRLVRIWTGDIEIHISADIAYAAHQYWTLTGDDEWYASKGAEIVLDTARFWASRAEWNATEGRYEYNDVIGPDEYHDHVDNNAYTNHMARWNLQAALDTLDWLQAREPRRAAELTVQLDLTPERLARWRDVIARIYLPVRSDGVLEQFEGYFKRKPVDLAALEPRTRSIQEVFGIEGTNETQALKQPDVLMLQYLLRDHFSDEVVKLNYDYYNARTDHTYGSSLGPAIQAIMACDVDRPDEAYEHFIRAVRADLRDVRGNAGDGIHGASAAGTWQSAVFGFGGLRVTPQGWTIQPRLPSHWKRLKFSFFYRGQPQHVELTQP